MLIGILGNLSVIVIVLKNKLLRLQVTNLFLLNMAISDLLNLTFNTIGYYFSAAVASSPSGVIFNQYYLGENMCTATSFFTSNTNQSMQKTLYYLVLKTSVSDSADTYMIIILIDYT